MKTALEILNQVEPNGELLDTDQAIKAMEMYADVKVADILKRIETITKRDLDDEQNKNNERR